MTDNWKFENSTFVDTRASSHFINRIKETRCITITGRRRIGKTFLARHIALDLQTQGYRIIPVIKPTDITYHYQPGTPTVFLIDDLCGKYTASHTQIEDWLQMVPVINAIIKDKFYKIIATCGQHVYEDDRFQLLEPFLICKCDLESANMTLTPFEKKNIEKKTKADDESDRILSLHDKLQRFRNQGAIVLFFAFLLVLIFTIFIILHFVSFVISLLFVLFFYKEWFVFCLCFGISFYFGWILIYHIIVKYG